MGVKEGKRGGERSDVDKDELRREFGVKTNRIRTVCYLEEKSAFGGYHNTTVPTTRYPMST
jgi:hypothetical protein